MVDLWVSKDDFDIISRTKKVNFIDALKFEFFYVIKEKVDIIIKWEKIVILPDEEIKFLQIYAYDPSGLIKFFDLHWFDFIDSYINWFSGQFLFQKR